MATSPATTMAEDPSTDATMDENSPSTDAPKDDDDMMTEENTTTADPSTVPRLMITRMELEDFKSYAGIQEIGPFHKCFSSVVGPNGSGKSNVIDALQFVFGKRAKALRLNRVSELIHKSTHCKPTSARVSVYFQEIVDTKDTDDEDTARDDNAYSVVPNSEVILTRIARKDNTSTYKLNGKTCQFKQVAAFLATKGIDLQNNRFLILQGEVELISMMPPKGKTEDDVGLLEYLEDIIGSSKYVEETNKVGEKLEELGELRQEKFHRVKAVEKEKESLTAAKQEAQALLSKERDIRRKENILYQIHLLEANEQHAAYTQRLGHVTEQLDAQRQHLSAASARVQEIQGGLAEQQLEYDKVHAELKQTKEEFSAYERRDIKLKEEIKHANTLKKKLEKKVETEGNKHDDAIAKGQAAEESLPQLEEQIQKLNDYKTQEDAKLEEIYEEMKGVTQTLRTELEVKTHELAPIQQEKAIFQNNLETAETEVKLLEDATTRAREKLESSEVELATLDQNQQAKRSELATCEDELEQSKARIVEAQKEDKAVAEQEVKLAAKKKELMARSEEAKASLQSKGGGRSSAVTGILKATRGGELSKVGVLGRLGDLATIPEQYDVAVSTACGSLDHIVVQTTAGAQKCLEFLRKHGLGRASFIPLDKMKKGMHDRVVETPEGAPRLFELISPANAAVTPAIFHGVGNTLVAPDLETATRWAYDFEKRWRVVTLDGKLIETAGTMSGGGKSVKRGGMKLANGRSATAALKEVEEESMDCKRLEEETEKAQELLQECRQKRKELANELRSLKKRVKALEIKLPKLAVEIEGFDTTRSELTKLIPELRSQCELSKSDAAKLVELNKRVQKCKTDTSSCAMKSSKLEAEVAKLQKAILDAGGSKLKNQQESCDEALSELNKAEKAFNSAKVAITSSEKAASKSAAAKAKAEEQLEECLTSLEDKKTERKSLEDDAFAVMQSYEEVKTIEAEKRAALEAVTKECEELQKSQSDVKVAEIDLVGKVEACEKQVAECEAKKDHWSDALDKLRADAEEEDDLDLSDDEEDDHSEPKENVDEAAAEQEQASVEFSDTDMSEAGDDSKEATVNSSSAALPTFSAAALEKYSKDAIKDDISTLEHERNAIAKNANMGAIAEYRKKEADYLARVAELDAVTEERNKVRKTHDDLRRKRLDMFMDGFGQITLKLKEMYQMITLGGDAELELVDSLDPFSEGIVFSVRPPKKSWKNISNLSGGEKTLSSLALVFALHHFKPTPLYVMDEIDAALDFKNVSIVANYIKDRTKNAQFVIISLRNNMFELADRLVGIYKTNNCTKSVTIDPKAFGVQGQQNGYVPPTPAFGENTNKTKAAKSGARQSVRRRVDFQSESSPMPVA